MRYKSKYLTDDFKKYMQDNWSMYITRKVYKYIMMIILT